MNKIRAAVVGYGNIGKYVVEALEAAPDFEIAGIVRRNGAENKPAELEPYAVVKDIKELNDVDVAILATPTRSVEKSARNTGNHFNFAEKQRQDLQKINNLNGSFLPDETHRAAVPVVFEFEWVSPPPDNIAA